MYIIINFVFTLAQAYVHTYVLTLQFHIHHEADCDVGRAATRSQSGSANRTHKKLFWALPLSPCLSWKSVCEGKEAQQLK